MTLFWLGLAVGVLFGIAIGVLALAVLLDPTHPRRRPT